MANRPPRRPSSLTWLGLGLAAGAVLALKERPLADLTDHVTVITGGSRGLGLLLAREFGRVGCRLAICARDPGELERARADLEARHLTVYAARCDVSDRRGVEHFMGEVVRRFGGIDVLVNNAGIIKMGPLESMTVGDFDEAMHVNFWGAVYPSLAVLSRMRVQGGGRIVNITSIGGNVSIPHLLPYSCAKAAAVAFSEGLRAEVARDGISVTTVVPGLMRTGSHVNAAFKGDTAAESTWFSLAATLPGMSIDAERAARRIVLAARRGDPEVFISSPSWVLSRIHGLFPGLTIEALRRVNELLLPAPQDSGGRTQRGHEALRAVRSPVLNALTRLGRTAAQRFGQYPAQRATGSSSRLPHSAHERS